MNKEQIGPASLRRTVFALFWALGVVAAVLPLPAASGPAADVGAASKRIFLAQLAPRGRPTNSQIPVPRGPGAGGPSSLGAKRTGITPKPGGTSSGGPGTRTPTKSGPAGGRLAISPQDMKRFKPKQSTPGATKKAVTKRPPSKVKKARAARPTSPRNDRPANGLPVPPFFPDQVVILVRDQPPTMDETLANEYSLQLLASASNELLEGRVVTYQLAPGQGLQEVIDRLDADPRIFASQTNRTYVTVQKSGSGKSSLQYSLKKLQLHKAHEIAQGRKISIAVIDTGVDGSHPSLANAIRKNFDAVNDGVPGPDNHGTGVAAVIGGQGKVRGVAPGASLLAVRAFYMHSKYKRPVTSSAILLRAVDWAFANKAQIFNMSFAGGFDPLLREALEVASKRGVIHVAAAGNGGSKAPPAYPAAYDNVLAITAHDQQDRLYSHANHGPYLTAAAPGVDVFVPVLKKGYRYSSGTSLAAAHVSGLVALLLERNPNASADDIVAAIRNAAHDLGPKGHDAKFGSGRVDAYASLLEIAP